MKFLTHPMMVAAAALVALPFASCNSQPETQLEVAEAAIECIEDINKVLDSVKDKDSADAAADEVAKLGQRLKELRKLGETLPEPTADQKAEMKMLEGKMKTVMGDFLRKLMPLAAADCYGSEKMKKAFEGLN